MQTIMMRGVLSVVACSILGVSIGPSLAENWPNWRGPRWDGTSLETGLPRQWSGTENVTWKQPVRYPGHASPIVWGNSVFLVGADEASTNRMLVALDRRTGKTLWERVVIHAPLETKNRLNSFASSTPATDGTMIYVTFLEVGDRTIEARNVSRPRPVTPGKMVVAAYDLDGNPVWSKRPGDFVSVHGFCSSPVLFEDKVIVNGDHDGDSYIVALDRKTGKTIWKTPRANKTRSYCTPLIRDMGGRTQMMLSGDISVCSYNPDDGSMLWHMDGPTQQFVASLVSTSGVVFVTGGFPDHHLLTIDPSGRGNITETALIRWHHQRASLVSYVPSPVAVEDRFVCISDKGFGACYEAMTGKIFWEARMGRRYSASLVTGDGVVYCLDDDGICKVIEAGTEYKVVAENSLNEPTFASIAVSDRQLFIRGEKNLYCIGKRQRTDHDSEPTR